MVTELELEERMLEVSEQQGRARRKGLRSILPYPDKGSEAHRPESDSFGTDRDTDN